MNPNPGYDPTGEANERFLREMREAVLGLTGGEGSEQGARQKAVEQCVQLWALASSTTFEGERINALAAIKRQIDKHGISLDEFMG